MNSPSFESGPATRQLTVLADGTVLAGNAPIIGAFDAGMTRGDGCFETTLLDAGEPRDLTEHLERMRLSATALDLALPAENVWRTTVAAAVAAWGDEPGVLRLICSRGTPDTGVTAYATVEQVPAATIAQRAAGIDIVLLPATTVPPQPAPWLLLGAKTLSYAVNMAAQRFAEAAGAADAVFVDGDLVLEGPRSSVLLALPDGTLVTPPADRILDGITIRRLLAAADGAGYRTERRPVTVTELLTAQGVWVTSSIRLLARVNRADGRALPPTDPALTRDLARLLRVPG